jgi:hypothetical protein
MDMIPIRNMQEEIQEAKNPTNDILETISILAEAMMAVSYNTVEIMDLSNFHALIPRIEEIDFPTRVDEDILANSKNLFAKHYIYNKILRREVDSTELLSASRLGFDSPHLFYMISAIIPLSRSFPYIIPRDCTFIHENHHVYISPIFPLIYGRSFTRAKFHIKITDNNRQLVNEFSSEETPRNYHSFRVLMAEIKANTKDRYLSFIFDKEIFLFESNFAGIYKRYRIVGTHSERFLPLVPKFLRDKKLLLEVLDLFTYLECYSRRCINYDSYI